MPKTITNASDLAEYLGANEPTERAMSRRLYKATSCGAWLTLSETGITVGSIVEGVDQTTATHALTFPFEATELDDVIADVENEVQQIWDATHGCDECSPEDEAGYRQVRKDCPSCHGNGNII